MPDFTLLAPKPAHKLSHNCQLKKKQFWSMTRHVKLSCGVLQVLLHSGSEQLYMQNSQKKTQPGLQTLAPCFPFVLGSHVTSYAIQGGKDCCKHSSCVVLGACILCWLRACIVCREGRHAFCVGHASGHVMSNQFIHV